MRIPRFLGQRVNGNAWDFALGKLHGVGTADLVHVHTGHGHVQLLCNKNQGGGQLLVRITIASVAATSSFVIRCA